MLCLFVPFAFVASLPPAVVVERLAPVAVPAAPAASGVQQQSGRRVIHGRVTDPTGAPVTFAGVYASGARVVANDTGYFRLEARARDVIRLDVRRIGFKAAQLVVPAGGDTTVVVTMEPVEQMLESVRVQANQTIRTLATRGFYRRLHDQERGINSGVFITVDDIDRRKPHRITQMFEGLQGVRIVRVGGECLMEHDPRCRAPVNSSGCAMAVYLDGRRLNPMRQESCESYAVGIDELALSTHVAGIEVYSRSGKVPPEYQSLVGRGGAILIWTR
ncbi:MAG TPA: carboxypeptidase-like regulatory domain-containing protein [Gemmatimonadaceae bacterium]|nr:carboxypeptidase-like regulatory domain-containing protein [Gemmatimonadaceae bacterium]